MRRRSFTLQFLLLVFVVAVFSCKKEDPKPASGVTVTASQAASITTTSAIVSANLTVAGDVVITAKGMCWSTNQNPTLNDASTSEGSGPDSFSSTLTGLAANTTYFVRAYTMDDNNTTTYSNQVTFKTLQPFAVTLTTNTVSAITSSGGVSGGSISSTGAGSIISKGVCWSTAQDPTINDAKTNDGTGTTSFTSQLTGLVGLTTYYVRAYATDNNNQTVYGNQVNFMTSTPSLMVDTTPVVVITTTTAQSGGIVGILDPMVSITVAGVCWNTSPGATIVNSKTQDATAEGPFVSSLTGLTAGTKYYVRAYATDNSGKTTYGPELSFTTAGGTTAQSSLDGKWIQDGQNDVLIINTTAGTGLWEVATFTPSAEYQVLINNNLATASTPNLKDIVKTSATTWTCKKFTFSYQGSGSTATITNVNYIPGTITLSNSGNTFTLVSYVSPGLGYPSSLEGLTLTSTWTRQ